MLPLIERLLAEAGWAKSSLDRIAVGRGPGSFVGLRVGIALAEGLGLGLGRPVVGVPSLTAMTAAVPADVAGTRVAVVDARRGELFVQAATSSGEPLLEAEAVARAEFTARLASLGGELVLVGEAAREFAGSWRVHEGPELDLPHALSVARLAATTVPLPGAVLPLYVRGPGATAQNLPPSPFGGA
jgi:tRNA threonylcarbamoyladenosine biosynthesis protein TsaB